VQLSTTVLVILIILVLSEIWYSGRYFWFLQRHKQELESTFIPDGRMDWMIHVAKLAAEERGEFAESRDRDHGERPMQNRHYLESSSFGNIIGAESARPQLARVYPRNSQSPFASGTDANTKNPRSTSKPFRYPPQTIVCSKMGPGKREENIEKDDPPHARLPSPNDTKSNLSAAITLSDDIARTCPLEHSAHPKDSTLSPIRPMKSSEERP